MKFELTHKQLKQALDYASQHGVGEHKTVVIEACVGANRPARVSDKWVGDGALLRLENDGN